MLATLNVISVQGKYDDIC